MTRRPDFAELVFDVALLLVFEKIAAAVLALNQDRLTLLAHFAMLDGDE